ncbi:MAG: hypothetical protein ACLQVL_23995 [Terriglobia bacterium]
MPKGKAADEAELRYVCATSAQSSVDAGQIRQNSFRLAMAVGDNRHYRINSITPRHFLQTDLPRSNVLKLLRTSEMR